MYGLYGKINAGKPRVKAKLWRMGKHFATLEGQQWPLAVIKMERWSRS